MKIKRTDIPVARIDIYRDLALSAARLVGFDNRPNHDAKLHELTVGIGQVAQVVTLPQARTANLIRVAAFCTGWLEALGEKRPYDEIDLERERQGDFLRSGEICFTVSSAIVDPKRKLRVLVEELGEVAEAINILEEVECKRNRQHLITELVQVAAVAVAWLETPEGKA